MQHTVQIEHLPWDSGFFEMKTGRIVLSPQQQLNPELILKAATENFKMVYVFAAEPEQIAQRASNEYACSPVTGICDLLYEIGNENFEDRMQVYTGKPTEELYVLAEIAGLQSRFSIDQSIPEEMRKKYWRAWLDNSFQGAMGDLVLIAGGSTDPKALLTLKQHGESMHIGLIATHPASRRQGWGTICMATAKVYAEKAGCNLLQVRTQIHNTTALQFYRRHGFMDKRVEYVTHVHL